MHINSSDTLRHLTLKRRLLRQSAELSRRQLYCRPNYHHGLKLCQTIDKVGRFCLPIKSANKNPSSVMQKSADFVDL